MLHDQIVEKTCLPHIRERLLLEAELTLDKALTLARLIEIAVADAKTFTESGTKLVSSVDRQGNKAWNPEVQYKQRGKRNDASQQCYRCGSADHLACHARLKQVNAKHVGR